MVGVDWYEFAMVELTIKHYLGQAWLIISLHSGVSLIAPTLNIVCFIFFHLKRCSKLKANQMMFDLEHIIYRKLM